MASPILDNLKGQVEKSTSVMGSAKALIDGFKQRLQDAIDAALANGATAEELQPVQAEADALGEGADALAAAVEANT